MSIWLHASPKSFSYSKIATMNNIPMHVADEFEEYPTKNAFMCLDMALRHCHGCSAYHLGAIMRRATLPPDRRTADHAEFNNAVSNALIPLIGSADPVKVVIGGTTDTGLYAGLLNAAFQAGGRDFARSLSVTIVDRCWTPLAICQRFAEKHQLKPQLQFLDFVDFHPIRSADLVLMHGVLSFFPAGERLAALRHVAGWLKAAGVMISSTQMGRRHADGEADQRIAHASANLERLMTEHGITDTQRRGDLKRHLAFGMAARDRHAELFVDIDGARQFYRDAGLTVESLTLIDNDRRSVHGLRRRYSARAIAFCRSGNALSITT